MILVMSLRDGMTITTTTSMPWLDYPFLTSTDPETPGERAVEAKSSSQNQIEYLYFLAINPVVNYPEMNRQTDRQTDSQPEYQYQTEPN